MPKRIVVIAVKGHVAAEAWYVLRFRASWSIIVVVGREIVFRKRANGLAEGTWQEGKTEI